MKTLLTAVRWLLGTLNPFRGPRTLSLWIALLFGVAAYVNWDADPPLKFVAAIEEGLLRLKFLARGPALASPEIVIAAVDERSIERYGQWPWDRKVIARLIETLKANAAKTIAFDMVFSEADERQGSTNLRHNLAAIIPFVATNGDPHRRGVIDNIRAAIGPSPDDVLAAVLEKSPGVILGYFLLTDLIEAKTLHPYVLEENLERVRRSGPPVVRTATNVARPEWPGIAGGARGVVAPIQKLADAAAQLAFFNSAPSPVSGTILWVYPARLVETAKERVPLFHIAVTSAAVQETGERPHLKLSETTGRTVIAYESSRGPLYLPTDFNGELYINYRGPRGMYKYFGIADIIEGRVPAHRFKDKLVFIGVSTAGLFDRKVTPFEQDCPGVEINATIADNILSRSFLQRPLQLPMIELAATGAIGLLLGFLLPIIRRPRYLIIAFIVVVGGLFVGDTFGLFAKGIWLKSGLLLLQSAITFILVFALLYFTQFRTARETRYAFKQYLDESILEEVLKDPRLLALGGARREVTVLFSDVRGFTTYSERAEATELVGILNEYLTRMSAVIKRDHKGTLDKYMGDAIMAFFGAPTHQPDHALRACRAALDMQTAIKLLQAKWVERGIPPLSCGIGLNTGVVIYGNMGSDHLKNYTVLGDEVNLGSRLEGLTKFFHVGILMSGSTFALVQNEIVARCLGRVRVKGKNDAVAIFEPLALKAHADAALIAYVEAFNSAVEKYVAGLLPEALSAFETLLATRDDETTRLEIEICRDALAAARPAIWDGAIQMLTK